jgi:UDP-N-acetylglucosamine---dolichyl-phosphate N-acetylglucosaminyltransferase
MKSVVVIPAYNEGARITDVIREVKKITKDIIVVDDGSKDNTYLYAKETGVTVLRHKVNLGKGAALKTGCDFATYKGTKQMVVLDADGQHEPKEIPKFLEALKDKDIVYGYRKGKKVMPFVLKFGNGFINNTLNRLFKVNIKDSQSGYRAFTSEAYKKIRWDSRDYYMETEMIIKAKKNKLSYAQIPIETIYGDRYKGTTVIDGAKIVLKIIGRRFLG